MRQFRYDNEEPDYSRLSGVGGWLLFLILRLVLSAVSSGWGIFGAVKAGRWVFAGLYVVTLLLAGLTVVLIFLRKKQLRWAYYAFAAASLLDYFLAQDASAFIACMAVEAGWILYLILSVRVKLLTGEMKPPED